ncbi:MAG: DJ-1/PfpI family protein [Paludibacteraceae bacterium]|nr:DJ-1/PfpI family protein [Paludibacteraceae bacterium]
MKKVYLFLADGFEEIEALAVVDLLRRAGVDVETVSVSNNQEVAGAHNVVVKADSLIADVKPQQPDMLILPGGMPGMENLYACEKLRNMLLEQNDAKRLIAAICASPSILGRLGLLKQRPAVCYPGFESELVDAVVGQEKVAMSDHIITSRAPGTAIPFALELIKVLCGEAMSDQIAKDILIK